MTMTRAELVRELEEWQTIAREVRDGRRAGTIEADGVGDGSDDLALLLGDAIDELAKVEVPLGELQVYAWSEDFGRQGSLGGLIVVNAEEREKIDRLCNECASVYLGEVLGKHSNISVDLEPGFFQVLDVPEEAARALSDHDDSFGTPILGAMMDLYDDEYADEDEGLDDLGDEDTGFDGDDEDFEDDDESDEDEDF